MSAPIIPPRPQQRPQASVKQQQQQQTPQIPPRPVRKTDPSPDREAYTRSPLNFPPSALGSNGSANNSSSNLAAEPPRRPPSFALPEEVGQEGLEYMSYDQLPAEAKASAEEPAMSEQTRNVAAELPMHAPKASLPQSAAKSRIQTVTRTDSSQAAAAGIGRARQDHDEEPSQLKSSADASSSLGRQPSRDRGDDYLGRASSSEGHHALRPRSSLNRASPSPHPAGTPRPSSIHSAADGYDHEHDETGIPKIGQQIPLYRNAGDVQAPSPAPGLAQHTPGIGFFNDGSQRAHHRKRSSRHEFGPPGSYGMHGHGRVPADQFEREWVAKHPQEAAQEEHSQYMLRPETAYSTDQLNKLVQENQDVGMGTSPSAIGTPSQDIAFEASDQFAVRLTTPRISPPAGHAKLRSSSGSHGQHTHTESPLRKQSYPFQHGDQSAMDSENDDDSVVHVDPDHRRGNKVTGGGAMDNTVDLGPTGGNTEEKGGWVDERGEGTPILASDEIVKRPGSAFLEPAVAPEQGRAADDEYGYDSDHLPVSRRSSTQPHSRPTSRPTSMHGYQGGSLHRFISHDEPAGSGMGTPLEEIEEYEPLFPDEGKEDEKPKVWQKRPGLAQHHFPSQDVWEDTPSSLQYMATVETPEPPSERKERGDGQQGQGQGGVSLFETPEEEARRKDNGADMTTDGKTFAKPHFKADVAHDLHHDRPGVQRFPSRDIWEDTPDSMRLVTTVSSPQMDDVKSPPEDRPTTAALPGRQDDGEARSTTGITGWSRPAVPARPERRSKLAQEIKPGEAEEEEADPRAKEVPDLGSREEQLPDRTKPQIPGRPKPSVPARPARAQGEGQAGAEAAGAPLSQTPSANSAGSGVSERTVLSPPPSDTTTATAQAKAKPPVPARPAGSKIAALQAGFMSDLNNRLKLGPQSQHPKAREEEEAAAAGDVPVAAEAEAAPAKEPLADARKSRARGPARRRAAPAAGAAEVPSEAVEFGFSTPVRVWSISDVDGGIDVPSSSSSRSSAIVAVEPEAGAEPASVGVAESNNHQEQDVLIGDGEPTVDTPPERKLSNEDTASLERELSLNEEVNTRTPTMKVRSMSLSSGGEADAKAVEGLSSLKDGEGDGEDGGNVAVGKKEGRNGVVDEDPVVRAAEVEGDGGVAEGE